MHNYCKTISALAAASALVAGNASAEVEYEMHTGYSTEYLFRGLNLGDNLTEFGVDAATEMNGFGLSAGVWSGAFTNATTSVYGPVAASDDVDMEIDMYAEVSYDFSFMKSSVGYIYYWNLGSLGVDDQEIYFSASRDFGWATTSFTYFLDIIENGGGNNGYSELALSRAFELSPCLKLNLSTSLGVCLEGFDATNWTTKASLDWGFAEHAKLSPFAAFSLAIDEINNTVWNQTENEILVGTMLSVGF